MGSHEEISKLALYLTSSDADYINGEIIRIDGVEYIKNSESSFLLILSILVFEILCGAIIHFIFLFLDSFIYLIIIFSSFNANAIGNYYLKRNISYKLNTNFNQKFREQLKNLKII